jgi:hypothetical protein
MAVVSSEDRRGPQPLDQQLSFLWLPKTVTVMIELFAFFKVSSCFGFALFSISTACPAQWLRGDKR